MPLARSGVFGPKARFPLSCLCMIADPGIHFPSSSLYSLCHLPFSMVHLAIRDLHTQHPHEPHELAWNLHGLRDFLDPVFPTFFWYPLLGSKMSNMGHNGTKKWPKSNPKSHFLPTWGTSFWYGIYRSGATLTRPGEVPKASKKTSLQKNIKQLQNIEKCTKQGSFWN